MICISIGHISLLEKVNEFKPSLLELRFDMLKVEPKALMQQVPTGTKVIATCRPENITIVDQEEILKSAISNGASYVDLEIEAERSYLEEMIAFSKEKGSSIIISYHNYDKTPSMDELKELLFRCYELGGDVAKIACTVLEDRDNSRLLSLYAEEGRKVILGMGNKGKITRLAALELGAEFTFASPGDSVATAPGQLSYSDLLEMKKILNRT